MSFYVGDAAGRIAGWKQGQKSDFSDCDRKFAMNLGIRFFTSEEYFLNEFPGKFEIDYINKDVIFHNSNEKFKFEPKDQELIIFVGQPACGKSCFFSSKIEKHGYIHINQDNLKTKTKCIQLCLASMKERKSIVIDNTNPSKERRKEYIDIAKKFDYKIRCFHFKVPEKLSLHLNAFREYIGSKDLVPALAYVMFKKHFETPAKDEGIDEIIDVDYNFNPELIPSQHKTIFEQYLY